MKKRMLRDIEVSEVGMGCMAFSHGYGQIPSENTVSKRYRMPITTAVLSLIRQRSTARTLPGSVTMS